MSSILGYALIAAFILGIGYCIYRAVTTKSSGGAGSAGSDFRDPPGGPTRLP